jgi:hypothetical protein
MPMTQDQIANVLYHQYAERALQGDRLAIDIVSRIQPPADLAARLAYNRNMSESQVHVPRPAPPKPSVRNCQSCHWDYWYDPNAKTEVEWRTSEKWCEYCHYVMALNGGLARVVHVSTWDRVKVELLTVRTFFATLGVLGLMFLGGLALSKVLELILNLVGG